MFITSEDHRFFSKLSSEDREEILWSGSSSSSDDDRRAATLQGSSGSFANSVGLLPALPETSSSSSEFSSPEDDADDSECEEEDDRAQLYPKSDTAPHRMGILRRSALGILTGARRITLYSDSSDIMPSKTHKKIPEGGVTQTSSSSSSSSSTFPAPDFFQEKELGQDPIHEIADSSTQVRSYPIISSGSSFLPVVMEEDDMHIHDRKLDEVMSQSSVEHVLQSATEHSDQHGDTLIHATPSWDSHSFNSHGGASRTRTKVERKKKKKSHRIPPPSTTIQCSTSLEPHEESIMEHMETELEARLHVIKHLKDTVVKQHEAMEQLSKVNTKLKAKLRIATKSLKATQSRAHEDNERIEQLEMELKRLKLKLVES